MASPRVAVSSPEVEPAGWLDRFFHLRENKTTVGTEVVAGLTTFMVMAYIIFVNPQILGFTGVSGLEGRGLPFAATMAATCLTAGLMTIAMGLVANYPLALAAGMGLNAVVAFQLVVGMKMTWPEAMGVIFLEGLVIAILVLTRLRQTIMDAIPMSQKHAIGVGIGFFIFFIGLFNGDLVRPGEGVPVALGKLDAVPVLVTIVGFFLTLGLMAARVRGALLIGIIGATALATVLNYANGLKAFSVPTWAVLPTQIVALPDFSTLGHFDPIGPFTRVGVVSALLVIFSIMLSDFFDTMGTVTAIGTETGFLDEAGHLPRLGRVLFIDSLGALFGGAASASSNTTYIESAAGVSAGGRTGLTAVVVGLLFLLALFFNPIVAMVPKEATAPALILVGFLMMGVARRIPFDDLDEGLPALLTMLVMPLTWSITNGIGAGFIAYTFLKLVHGKGREVSGLMYAVSAAFIVYFAMDFIHGTFHV